MQVLNVDYTARNAAELFCQSLKETGFAVLNKHPLPVALINNAYEQWEKFFNSSVKHDYLYDRQTQDGYFPFKAENAKGRKHGDLKEFYHIYPWGKIPESTREASFELYQALQDFAAKLLQWVEDFLPTTASQYLSMPLKDMIKDSKNTLLRVLHYPPLQGNEQHEEVRAAAHEDINLITLLPAATTPGLEVLDVHGNWHEVNCNPGNIVVNVGDMLQMCTQYYYKSTTHRVVNPRNPEANCSRFSMPLFLHPNDDVKLSDTHTAVQYKHERLREIGVY